MEEKLAKIQEDIASINKILAVNTAILELHIKRTEIAEARLDKLQYTVIGLLVSIVVAGVANLLR